MLQLLLPTLLLGLGCAAQPDRSAPGDGPRPAGLEQIMDLLRDHAASRAVTKEGSQPPRRPATAPPICRGLPDAESTNHCREEAIKGAIRHAWRGYAENGWGSDDFSPLLRNGVENWHARSTIYDSLDTLWLAGMHEEFDDVVRELHWRGPPLPLIEPTKLFEYNIRVIGGLLGAYTLSLRPELLHAAALAADALIDCAEQWNEPLPMPTGRLAPPDEPVRQKVARLVDSITRRINLGSGRSGSVSLAGAGSFSLEMRYLTRETGNRRYARFAEGLYWQMVKQDAVRYGDSASRANVFDPNWRDNETMRWKPQFVPRPPRDGLMSMWFQTSPLAGMSGASSTAGLSSGGDSFYECVFASALFLWAYRNCLWKVKPRSWS